MAGVARPVETPSEARAATAQRYFALALLTAIYALNFLDRTLFNVLIEPIKREFGLSDTVMGLLAGFAFVAFYSLLGIPIARFADRRNRRSIVALAAAFWSAMTVCCGLASNAILLAFARVGVGIGESAGTPASQSIVADLFDRNERSRALGIYAVGTYLGIFLGYFVGGWVNQHHGWRMAFVVAGIPGLALAALLRLTVAEPRRGAADRTEAPRVEALGPTLGFLFTQRTFVVVLAGFCLTTYTNYATSAWIPPFLARVHRLTSVEIGTYAGTFKGLFGMAGVLLGGFVVARIGRDDDRWKLWAPAIASAAAAPAFAICLLTPSFGLMIATLAAFSLLAGFHLGPIFAIAQSIARPGMRALGSAIVLLSATCFGQGVGPLTVGMMNDALKAAYGADAVRYSLLLAALTTFVGALLFVWAARSIRADLERAEAPA